jgi:hypothetical protein
LCLILLLLRSSLETSRVKLYLLVSFPIIFILLSSLSSFFDFDLEPNDVCINDNSFLLSNLLIILTQLLQYALISVI